MPRTTLSRRSVIAAGAATAIASIASRAFAESHLAPGGFSAERLAKIPVALKQHVDQGSPVGLVSLIYRHGEVAQVNALGFQAREANVPMQRDTIFRLASMTKPVTCAAALTLVDQGKIGLNDPIDKWIPELANPKVLNDANGPVSETHAAPRAITVSDLLTHQSGIGFSQTANAALMEQIPSLRDETKVTADEWIKAVGELPLAFDPGTRWNYGTSHDVLGVLIERVSGRPFVEYLSSAILDPLGMTDTGFWLPQDKHRRLAVLYGIDPETGNRVAVRRPLPSAPPKFAAGAGALVSTADDYLKFARMLLNQGRLGSVRILARSTVKLMTTNWLTPQQRNTPAMGNPNFWASQGFGLGVAVTDDVSRLGAQPYSSPGSFNWPGATGVWWRADPVEDMILIWLIQNASPMDRPTRDTARSAAPPLPRSGQPNIRALPTVVFSNLAYHAIEV